MSGHTVRPWRITDRIFDGGRVIMQEKEVVALVYEDSNAQLIADAPKTKRDRDDLLAAAKMADEFIAGIENLDAYGNNPLGIDSLQALRAAIEKAEDRE